MTQKKLRVVASDDVSATQGVAGIQKAPTVRAAAESGSRRQLLVALRARIAADVDNPNTPARDLAALSRRLLEIAKEVEAIDAHEESDEIGDAASTADEEWAAN